MGREVVDVGVGGGAHEARGRVGNNRLHPLGGQWGGGGTDVRVLPDTQAEEEVRPDILDQRDVRRFIHPCRRMLWATQTVRLFAGEGVSDRPVGPCQLLLRRLPFGTLPRGGRGEHSGLPLDHGVSGVGASRCDEGDAWGPLGDPVRPSGASGGLPGTTPPGDEPCEPVVAARGVLVGAPVREVPFPVRLAVAGHLVAVERLPRLVGEALQAEQGSFLGGRRPPAPLLVVIHESRVLPCRAAAAGIG